MNLDLLQDYLTREGYAPTTEAAGLLHFTREGQAYRLEVFAADPQALRLTALCIWPIQHSWELRRVHRETNRITRDHHGAKVFVIEGDQEVWAAIDLVLPDAAAFFDVFQHCLGALSRAVSDLRASLRNQRKEVIGFANAGGPPGQYRNFPGDPDDSNPRGGSADTPPSDTQPEHGLICLPCLDSAELATRARHDLDIDRERAVELGRSAVAATTEGMYRDDRGRPVVWREAVQHAIAGKISLPPDHPLPRPPSRRATATRVQIRNETTLVAAKRLVDEGQAPLALNFANGLHPGGGFLHGARAQEEVLCRSSALYATLAGDPMYAAHASRSEPDSTEWAIYSPEVPVFRTDWGWPLAQPWLLDVLTCAAPYAPRVGRARAADLLQARIHRVLAIAEAYGHATLVLGAWGCGAFGNDPARTARDFRDALEGDFRGAFADIVFAIVDWSPERRFLEPFKTVFHED
ncbi:MAG: TIGR02452 family protein [Methylococcus sp.]